MLGLDQSLGRSAATGRCHDGRFRTTADAASRYGVVNHHREDGAPSIARLNALVEAKLRAAGIDVPHQ
ncbi:hypothetical protein [Streptomyces sp. NPDC058623]|uniref:hypothetical protein n=1 Tax=Streptomyces sp. NPDC058623 TaxID=3346563 RepID=UPI003647E87D